MTWSPSLSAAEIISGPYLLGKGTAGSETDIGEIIGLAGKIYYVTAEVKGGASLGTETVLDEVPIGIRAELTFGLMQNIGDTNKSVFAVAAPGSTPSTGPTSKALTFDANAICGIGFGAGSLTGRWVLHKKSVTDKADTSSDIVFPKGVVYPSDETFNLMGDDGAIIIPCRLVGFLDTNNYLVAIGKDAS